MLLYMSQLTTGLYCLASIPGREEVDLQAVTFAANSDGLACESSEEDSLRGLDSRLVSRRV